MMYASTKDLIKGFMDGVSTELQVRTTFGLKGRKCFPDAVAKKLAANLKCPKLTPTCQEKTNFLSLLLKLDPRHNYCLPPTTMVS
eukprot:scaffold162624_cov15-Tisochrysis_lutea.AAC.2